MQSPTQAPSTVTHALVFPCASGVGQEVFYALKHHKDVVLWGANSGEHDRNPGGFLWRDRYLGNAPPMSDVAACLAWLRGIVARHSINAIYPAYDDAQVWLKAHESELGGALVITSSLESAVLCRSKSATYAALAGVIRCPAVFKGATNDGMPTVPDAAFPVFIKPDRGEGSKGCHTAHSRSDLEALWTADSVVTELLPGEEFTVDCLTGADRKLLFAGPRRRSMTRAGISILTECVADPGEFGAMAQAINAAVPFVGAWFFQVKRALDSELALLEVAPRISGAMAAHRALGVNFPALSLYIHMGKPVTVLQPSLAGVSCCKVYANHFMVPAFEGGLSLAALYVDMDDTLLAPLTKSAGCENKPPATLDANPDVMSILYQARAVGLPVHLITRHAGDVRKTLALASVCETLFTSICHLSKGESKGACIRERPAALLDDSFRERADAGAAGVHEFDVDALDLLRDVVRAAGKASKRGWAL